MWWPARCAKVLFYMAMPEEWMGLIGAARKDFQALVLFRDRAEIVEVLNAMLVQIEDFSKQGRSPPHRALMRLHVSSMLL